MVVDITNLQSVFLEELKTITKSKEIDGLRVKYLGKTGAVSELLKELKNIPNEEKREFGKKVNDIKQFVENNLEQRLIELTNKEIEEELKTAKVVDLTIPYTKETGSLHPITIIQDKIIQVFRSMGFHVENINEIETEYNNFEAVLVSKNHPARDMQDTFYLENGQVLSTHTSSSQNRILRKYGAPVRAIFPGRCFRNEELDSSHDNTFFQLEGMFIDKDISISNLVYFMKEMLSNVLGKEIEVRLRPGYFPFTEPSFELDSSCPYCDGKGCKVCKNSGWIELCPCGMVHPDVLKEGGINPEEYQGFAFGLGLSRLAMIRYDINDIRVMNGGNLKQLKQMKIK